MRIALALIACAGLGFAAGRQPVLPTDSQRSEPGPAEGSRLTVTEKLPVETPLVDELLVKEPAGPADGDLTPGGNFRFSAARKIWVPVDKGNRRYTHNRRPVTAAHLIAEHGHHPSCANQWTQEELDIAHANDHRAELDRAIPSGHWETRRVCTRRGCNDVRVWVQD